MVGELQTIQVHLWVITGLLTAIFLAAGYCNYSRIKEQNAAAPFIHMNDLWEREKFVELREYTSSYLKLRPNTPKALSFHAMVSLHFRDYDEARRAAEKLAKSSPQMRGMASELLAAITAAAAS